VEAAKSGRKTIDPTPFLISAIMDYGVRGAKIAMELTEAFGLMLHVNPWRKNYRRIEWKDITERRDLFESESICPAHGRFFDQRFVDFLHRNFDEIDSINWRKFEALTCEFFDRAGFRVEIGKGRGDDTIDARVWPKNAGDGLPPAILVQCKRERRKIGKVVVKALYADVIDERALSGLVVTTTSLSPGAKQVCVARGYPIQQAERRTLHEWIAAMRTPYRGAFLAA
jgi:restriction system protein